MPMSGKAEKCLECGVKQASVQKVVKGVQYWRCSYCHAEWTTQ